jgi:hypothetical protein
MLTREKDGLIRDLKIKNQLRTDELLRDLKLKHQKMTEDL